MTGVADSLLECLGQLLNYESTILSNDNLPFYCWLRNMTFEVKFVVESRIGFSRLGNEYKMRYWK